MMDDLACTHREHERNRVARHQEGVANIPSRRIEILPSNGNVRVRCDESDDEPVKLIDGLFGPMDLRPTA